ncbi:MAG: glycosyltransferase [Nitrospirae bacterium CG_4_9_14_3_um_filter_53_35]|nr:glycosyltransferase family 2 protein [Deltaproteobacteria bacterium]PIS36754.1 MAG: glycosyltransferase [Nitrospirae bacterium CG08_land_8_20_14_0_20_52_24]PIX85098.1 MAG: glycosyltransferase [Nitrospirae bacterium CG_4_10_14_3_um_filter_53_41]PJA75449.1 MAG: glycosyltransferase [Nitrospirae bacterium CG_4_9_14_3_um_filter_53_35]
MDLSVIVPLYNEKENVDELYRRIKRELQKLSLTYEVIFVDDGSTDGTTEAIKEIKKAAPELKVIIFNRNYGQSEAMAAGFEAARGEVLVTMDGDLQNDPADIIRILMAVRSGYHVVCGWRQIRKDNLFLRRIPSALANALIAYVTKVKIRDLGCSLKGYRRDIIKHIHLYSEMHRFIPIVAASIGSRITEVPVSHKPRVAGKSKYGLSRTWKVLLDLIKIKLLVDFSSKPMTLFGLSSIPFWFLGTTFLGFYYYDFLNPSLVPDHAIVTLGSGILFIFLAFSLVSFGYLMELVIKTGDYKQNKILGDVSWIQK